MKYFCHNPFLGLDIQTNGNLRPCCKFDNAKIDEPFNIRDGISNYKNSQWLKELQNQFIAGGKPDGCKRCWKEEAAGVLSKRQLDYARHQESFDTMYLKNSKFINIGLVFGNLCNLACRICSHESSSKWASEKKKMDGKNYPIHTWHQDKKLLEDIYNTAKNAIHIDIAGGEPLLVDIEEHFKFIARLVRDKKAGQMSLHYTTNGTTFPKESHLKLWKSFKEIDIQLSLDDVKERFEYNRWPAKWSSVYNNIKKYQTLSKSYSNIRLSISHTVSAFTILYADNFFKWCIREGLPAPWMGLVSSPWMGPVPYPVYYGPSVFPTEVRDKISSQLDQSKIKEVKLLKNYLNDDTSHGFKNFLSMTQLLDNMRNQNFQKTFPELAELIWHYI